MSRRVLNISREGDSTTSLGSLFQGSVTLRGKKFFLMFRQNFLCFNLCPEAGTRFRNTHVPSSTETAASPSQCCNCPLYPTKMIPVPLGYSTGWGALIHHNILVVPWLPVWAGIPALQTQPVPRLPGCRAWCLTLLKNKHKFFVPRHKAQMLSLGDLLTHSSPFFWFKVAYECSVFSPKPLTDMLNHKRARPEPHQSWVDTSSLAPLFAAVL